MGLNSVASVATYSPDTSIIFPNRRAIALTKMLTVNDVLQMPALLNSHVHMNDKNQVAAKIFEIVRGKHEKLQIITDFDYTLTKYHNNGSRCHSCHGVIENNSVVPSDFKKKTRSLFEKYYPIEIDPHMSEEEKIPHMIQWYEEGHEQILQCGFTRDDFSKMIKQTPVYYRDGTKELVDLMEKHSVPMLVFSAGLGDIIDMSLQAHNLMRSNMKVISNYMEFDESDRLVRFSPQLIHMFNKNESALRNSSYFQELSHRHNVILMGDSMGDLRMAHGVEPPSTVLNIGFLNDKIDERLSAFKEKFDIVLTDDQTLEVPRAIIELMLKAE